MVTLPHLIIQICNEGQCNQKHIKSLVQDAILKVATERICTYVCRKNVKKYFFVDFFDPFLTAPRRG
jgi:hypothetical protein